MTTTFEWLRTTLAQDYNLEPAALTPDASLETLGLDSLAVAELLFAVEEKFKITVMAEPPPLKTLKDVYQFIDAQIAVQHGDLTAKNELPSSSSAV
ncbi:acyl carrier protein [Caballeronia sp. SBC2]|uniref:acyl carrier protein n=1 Tax=Caballeronia sp. SBC2 TaxID=2705547 RepID=UPI0013E1AA46|nr:acyl carrier protein [Caballeronia sp. SBC2]QIE29733.1 Acyl carrier protein [Caballeronia sp. SBC2]